MDFPLRLKVTELLVAILKKLTIDTPENINKMKNVEIGIFNYTIENSVSKNKNWSDPIFKETYMSRARALIANLNPDGYVQNKKFLFKYLNGEISPERMCKITHQQMFPERYLELEFLQNKSLKEVMVYQEKVYDSLLKCGRCRQNTVSYYEVQTRSADEPTTKFCTCTNCGKKFTFC